MVVDYKMEQSYTESIDIVDAGNTCVRCISSSMDEYYILISTTAGKTSILKIGPIVPDVPVLENGFMCSYRKTDYKEATIYKELNNFINDDKKDIDKVEEVLLEEVEQCIPNIIEAFKLTME